MGAKRIAIFFSSLTFDAKINIIFLCFVVLWDSGKGGSGIGGGGGGGGGLDNHNEKQQKCTASTVLQKPSNATNKSLPAVIMAFFCKQRQPEK